MRGQDRACDGGRRAGHEHDHPPGRACEGRVPGNDGAVEQSLAQRGALVEETALWQTLLREHPDWFAPIDLPKRRELLMLAMLSREEEFHVLA